MFHPPLPAAVPRAVSEASAAAGRADPAQLGPPVQPLLALRRPVVLESAPWTPASRPDPAG